MAWCGDKMEENWLKIRLNVLGITRQELVDRLARKDPELKREPQTVSHWTNGNPISLFTNPEHTKHLAEALDWTVAEMLMAAGYEITTVDTDLPPELLPLIMQLKRIDPKRLKLIARTILFSTELWLEVMDEELSNVGKHDDNSSDDID
jgi:hypothetical protein